MKKVPDWLSHSSLFKKVFLFRKLYLSKIKSHHFSQFAEDISIGRFFPKNHKGFFVDVGCFHPKKYNNTWLLYKKGWRGVNIDIDAIKIQAFDIARSKDTNINAAVSDVSGPIHYWDNGYYSLTTSISDNFVSGKTGYVRRTTDSSRLEDLLDSSPYKNKVIDLLSVDVEGHDLEVLRSLDFSRYQPKLIAVEIHHPLFKNVMNSDLYKFLIEKEYCLVGWCGLTLLMANKKLQIEISS